MRKSSIGIIAFLAVVGGVVPSSGASVPPHWTGSYFVHAGGIAIRTNGTILVNYQWYPANGGGMPRFAQLTLRVTNVNATRLTGKVVSSRRSTVDPGARFTLIRRAPGVRLRVAGFRPLAFCDEWHKEQGVCGA